MPTSAPSICPTCKNVKPCNCVKVESHQRQQRKKMYNRRWRKASKNFLSRNPLCSCDDCNKEKLIADCVHHKIEHEGDQKLFWDVNNWQALNRSCHSKLHAKKRRST